jgi:hypothetical protein
MQGAEAVSCTARLFSCQPAPLAACACHNGVVKFDHAQTVGQFGALTPSEDAGPVSGLPRMVHAMARSAGCVDSIIV